MRKFGLLVMITLLLTALCLSAQADALLTAKLAESGEDDLSYEDALFIAREIWAENNDGKTDETNPEAFGVIACFITLQGEGGEERAWHMVLQERGGSGSQFEALIYSPEGEKTTNNKTRWVDKVTEWEAAKGPRPFWTPEDMALFYRLYERVIGEDMFVIAMPREGNLSSEEAIEIAIATLVKDKGEDEAALKALKASTTYWEPMMDDPGENDVPYWAVCFYNPDIKAGGNYSALSQVNIKVEDEEPFFVFSVEADGPGNG